jgi:alkylation response protein AidB-like acyl-CoA dehydrogenase
MCLTEPHCGTDLGLIRTKAAAATPTGPARFRRHQNLHLGRASTTSRTNIVHLVLAKLPDAPDGVKGISLFVVPKFLPKDDGSVGAQTASRVRLDRA